MRRVVLVVAASLTVVACTSAKDQGQRQSMPSPRIHPHVFSMVESWYSDTEDPVVTGLNLDAMEGNRNQFPMDEIRQEGVWTVWDDREGRGFERYRVVEEKDGHCTVEYQKNGGGTLTTASIIGFGVERREIRKDGRPTVIRILRVDSISRGKSSDPFFGD